MPNITFMIRCGRTRVPNPGPPVAVISKGEKGQNASLTPHESINTES